MIERDRHLLINRSIEIENDDQPFELTREEIAELRKFRQSVSLHLKQPFYSLPSSWRQENINWLIRKHLNNLHFWYYDGLIDIYDNSRVLASSSPENFLVWWNPDCFDWDRSIELAKYQDSNFDSWWNPDKFSYCNALSYLAKFKNFDDWWIPEKMPSDALLNKGEVLSMLASNHSNKFDIWWNYLSPYLNRSDYIYAVSSLIPNCADMFNDWWIENWFPYNHYTLNRLIKRCSDYIEVWWNKEKVLDSDTARYYFHLIPKYACHKFDIWFDPSIFKFKGFTSTSDLDKSRDTRILLIKYCSDNFEKWWDVRRYRHIFTDALFELLFEKCSNYQHIWGKEYVVYTLSNEGK